MSKETAELKLKGEAQDNRVEGKELCYQETLIERTLTEKEEMLLSRVKENLSEIKNIPKKEQFFELALYVLNQNPTFVRYISKKLLTDDLMKYLVSCDWKNIQYSANPSDELCLIAVNQNYLALSKIKNPSEEVYLATVEKNGIALEFVKTQTYEICKAAVSNWGDSIKYVREDLKTEEIYLLAVKQHPFAIRHIENPSEDVQKMAVSQNGMSLKMIENPSEDVCVEAIKHNPSAIQYVKNQTEKICNEAIKRKPKLISYVKNKTEDICLRAIALDETVMYNLSREIAEDEEFLIKALKVNPSVFRLIRHEVSRKVIETALMVDGMNLKYIKEENRTLELCMLAVERTPEAVAYFKF